MRAIAAITAIGAALACPVGAAAQTTPSTNGCTTPPQLTATIPKDSSMTQQDVNCFAWQEFIALNWLADTTTCAADASVKPSSFGDPANRGPVVWQTYKSPGEVFLSGGDRPPDWCMPQTAAAADSTRPYRLSAINKFALGPQLDLDDIDEASPKGSWLTAQSGKLTLYDIRLNNDEFEYIVANELYDAERQRGVATSAQGLSLPDQSNGSTGTGSIELKAAWTELADEADWPRFLTTKATVTYPGERPTQATMGLVGLHIIHKTYRAQQFVWATFEHIDNAPSQSDVNAGRATGPYTFYNPKCEPDTDPYRCVANPTTQKPGDPPTPPYSAPVQVVRNASIPTSPMNNDIPALNAWVWSLIRKDNASSVFLNYELVGVLWPNANTRVAAGATTPLPTGNPQPVQPPVANTTLETYVQGNNCLACHVYTQIASSSGRQQAVTVTEPVLTNTQTAPAAPLAADYSFLLGHAKSSSGGGPGTAVVVGGGGLLAAAAVAAGVVLARRRRAGSA